MRTETLTVKVYKWEELSDKAKEAATYKAQISMGYPWADDAIKSLKALAEHFGGSVSDYSVDFCNSSYSHAKFDMPSDIEKPEIARRLKALGSYNRKTLKGNGDCALTGYGSDEDAIDGFRAAFLRDGETDLEKLMQAAFKTWLKAAQNDCEAMFSDEGMKETSEANDCEYTEDGEIYY